MKLIDRIKRIKDQPMSKIIHFISIHLIFVFSLVFSITNLYKGSKIFSIVDSIIMLILSLLSLLFFSKKKNYIFEKLLAVYILMIVLPLILIIGGYTSFTTLIFVLLLSFFTISLSNEKLAIILCGLCLIEYSIIYFLLANYPSLFTNIIFKKTDILLFQPIVSISITLMLFILFYHYNKSVKNAERINKQLERDSKLNNMLLNLTYLATKDNDIESILDYILNEIIGIVECAEKGSIIKNVDGKCEFICVSGYDINVLKNIKMPINNCHLYKLTDGKMDKTVHINGFDKIRESYMVKQFNSAGFFYNSSTLTSPIYVDGKVWGIVNLDSSKNTIFNSSDYKLAEILSIEIAKLISFSLLLTDNENLKNKDALTHLYNRRYFTDIVEEILAYDEKTNLTIVEIDLDNLKKINDNYGHINGDKYIIKLAKALTMFFDDKNIISRYGGDEFFILLKDKTKAQAKAIIDRIKSYLDNSPLEICEHKVFVDFSYGIIESDNKKRFEDLIALTDYEMYSNKHLKKATAIILNKSKDKY